MKLCKGTSKKSECTEKPRNAVLSHGSIYLELCTVFSSEICKFCAEDRNRVYVNRCRLKKLSAAGKENEKVALRVNRKREQRRRNMQLVRKSTQEPQDSPNVFKKKDDSHGDQHSS